jgi:hypothetical protein
VQGGEFGPIVGAAVGVDAAERKGVAQAANGSAERVGGAATRAETHETRGDFAQSESAADVGIIHAQRGGQGWRGLGSGDLETQGEGGGIYLARTRHYAGYFAQLNRRRKGKFGFGFF